jgi:hypothetical protein
MKRFFVSENGSLGALEGLVLALFAIALIVGIRMVVFPSKPGPAQQPVSVKQTNHWPELPAYEPIRTTNPLRD